MNRDWKPGEFRVHAAYQISTDGMDIFAAWKNHQGQVQVLAPVQLLTRSPEPGVPWIASGSDIGYRQLLQGFLDAAWEIGIRPAGWKDTELQLGATVRHLADMRAIVGKQLKVELP